MKKTYWIKAPNEAWRQVDFDEYQLGLAASERGSCIGYEFMVTDAQAS